jgi:excisionase family DNA binding protein
VKLELELPDELVERIAQRVAELVTQAQARPEPAIYSVRQLAARWQVTPDHVYRLCNQGRIDSHKLGRKRAIPAYAVRQAERDGLVEQLVGARR